MSISCGRVFISFAVLNPNTENKISYLYHKTPMTRVLHIFWTLMTLVDLIETSSHSDSCYSCTGHTSVHLDILQFIYVVYTSLYMKAKGKIVYCR